MYPKSTGGECLSVTTVVPPLAPPGGRWWSGSSLPGKLAGPPCSSAAAPAVMATNGARSRPNSVPRGTIGARAAIMTSGPAPGKAFPPPAAEEEDENDPSGTAAVGRGSRGVRPVLWGLQFAQPGRSDRPPRIESLPVGSTPEWGKGGGAGLFRSAKCSTVGTHSGLQGGSSRPDLCEPPIGVRAHFEGTPRYKTKHGLLAGQDGPLPSWPLRPIKGRKPVRGAKSLIGTGPAPATNYSRVIPSKPSQTSSTGRLPPMRSIQVEGVGHHPPCRKGVAPRRVRSGL